MGLGKDELIKLIEEKGASSTDFVIRTPEEETAYLENFKQSEVEKVLGQKIGDLHKRYDEDIFAVTGLKKSPSEHTYEFNKRVLADYKAKMAEYEGQVSELKEKTSKTGDPKLHADLENVQKEFKEFKTAKEREVEELKKDYNTYKVKSVIEGSLSAFEFDTAIPEIARKVLIEKVVNDLTSTAEIRDKDLVFVDAAGNPLRNKNKNLEPYTAEELLSEHLKDIIKQKRIIIGAKIGDPKTKVKSLPDNVTTKAQLGDYLKQQGLIRGSKEYDEAYKELREGLPDGY